jgi:hypothetical protein
MEGDTMGFDLSLSASKLGIFRECHRCFYDINVLNIKRPDSIVASITGGIDRTAKAHFDEYRGGLPPALQTQVPGFLYPDIEKMKKMRHWKSGLKAEVEVHGIRVGIIGALDDLLMNCPGYSPLDAKSKGDEPKDDGSKYYSTQSHIYGLLLDRNGMPPSGLAYFAYFWPIELSHETSSNSPVWDAGCKVYALECSPDKAVETIGNAVLVLKGGQPPFNPLCTYCTFAQVRVNAAVENILKPVPA